MVKLMGSPAGDEESHIIQTADYAEANELIYKPGFAWWDPFTLKKKYKMIDNVKS